MSERQDRQGARTPADLERKYQFGKRFAEIMGIALDAQKAITAVDSELRLQIEEQYTKIMRDTEQIILEASTKYVNQKDYDEFRQTVTAQFKVMADEISANLQSTTDWMLENSEFHQYCENLISATANQVALNMMSTTESFTEVLASLENQQAHTEELREYYESEIVATAQGLDLKFQSSIDQITEVNGDVHKINEELQKYFEFGTDGLTIKAGDTEMKIRIDNNLIAFYKGDIDESDLTKNRFGWWDGVNFYTGNIVVEVEERAQFGNFAYIPRSNGSLDFLKVGG